MPFGSVGYRDALLELLRDFPLITDARPRTEYYLLHHRFTSALTLTGTNLDNFIRYLKSASNLL